MPVKYKFKLFMPFIQIVRRMTEEKMTNLYLLSTILYISKLIAPAAKYLYGGRTRTRTETSVTTTTSFQD